MTRKKKLSGRVKGILAVILALLVGFTVKLGDLQIVRAEKYASQGDRPYTRRATIKAARGEILDRYGRPIAQNRVGYDVVFNRAYMTDGEINPAILRLTADFTSAGVEWLDELPMTAGSSPAFTDDEAAVARLKRDIGLNRYATASDCLAAMTERYSLSEVSPALRRTVMGVRYTMERRDFSVSNPYTFAEDIPSDLMLHVSEISANTLHGVEISVVQVRVYPDGTLAPHIIGTVQKMTAEDWEEKKDQGYSYDDKIGKGGIEEKFESVLHGTDGVMLYRFDKNGNVTGQEVLKEPVPGNTVILTLDSRLQKTTEDALKSAYTKFNSEGYNIGGAAAVVMNVNTGEILTAATYPSYDLNTYSEDIEALLADKRGAPLTNRAFTGAYQPGSTFKPATAIAALSSGAVTPGEVITCTGVYNYFEGYPHRCTSRHGSVNMVRAISRSCNYYFYEVGRRTGIEKLNEVCRKLGLGVKTGVEVEESAGILAGPDYTSSINEHWYEGNTIQAAIGQSYNMLTPLQLANYTATIANGGTRYRATLLRQVKDYSLKRDVTTPKPEVAERTGFSADILGVVKQGMLSVTQDGTARAYFSDYPIKVGGKTGTAQNNGPDHAVFTAFAPFENPEIALAVIFENGLTSATTGPVAKTILDTYFYGSFTPSSRETPGTLLP